MNLREPQWSSSKSKPAPAKSTTRSELRRRLKSFRHLREGGGSGAVLLGERSASIRDLSLTIQINAFKRS